MPTCNKLSLHRWLGSLFEINISGELVDTHFEKHHSFGDLQVSVNLLLDFEKQ